MTLICCDAYLIYDHHVGDEICEDCGRVTRFFEDANHTEQNQLLLNSVEFELKKICDNNNFVDSIFETALAELRKRGGNDCRTCSYVSAFSLSSFKCPSYVERNSGHVLLTAHDAGKKEPESNFFNPPFSISFPRIKQFKYYFPTIG